MYTFSRETQSGIDHVRSQAAQEALRIQDALALEVVENGGYCDDLTFATVFFGGVDAVRYANDPRVSRRTLMAVPEAFSDTVSRADELAFLTGEPYVAGTDTSDRYGEIGIVLPPAPGHILGVGYKIEAHGRTGAMESTDKEETATSVRFAGSVVFAGYSRTITPHKDAPHVAGEQALLRVDRTASEREYRMHANQTLAFGVSAVRKHVLGSRRRPIMPTQEQNDGLAAFITDLRATAFKSI